MKAPQGPKKESAFFLQYYRSAVWTALAAGVFSLSLIAVLTADYLSVTASNPLASPEFASLQESLRQTPTDESVKERIRSLDLELRGRFFRRQRLVETGRYMLLVGLAVFLISVKVAFECRKKQHLPPKAGSGSGQETRAKGIASISVTIFGIALTALAVVFVIASGRPPTGEGIASAEPQTAPDADAHACPSSEEWNRNWPRFRGPDGVGVAVSGEGVAFPTSWNTNTGQGILWKTPVPLKGASSPIVWNDRIFLTGATVEKREVYCFDAASGRLLWQKNIGSAPGTTGAQVWDEKTHAAATPVTDGRRVCAIFANGDLACLDCNGNELWRKRLGPLHNSYGHASSLDMYQNYLIVLLDQQEADDGRSRSKLMALDVSSGRVAWETPRPTRDSWTSPIIINAAGHRQIITASMPWVIAYDAVSGAEIWKVNCLKGDVAPSPIYAGGLVFAVMEMAGLTAVRPDGKGDVAATHVAWQVTDGDFPSVCSPVSNGSLLFLLNSSGLMTAWDIAASAMVWEQDLGVSAVSSPTLVGEHVYVFGEGGEGIVLKASAEYVEVARSQLGEPCQASPAFVAGRIYIRGENHLFCIGEK